MKVKRKYDGQLFTFSCDNLIRDISLSSDARFLFILLKSYLTKGTHEGTVFPSIRTIRKFTRWGNGRIYNALGELEERGLLSVASGHRKKGSKENTVNRYRLVDDFDFYGVSKPVGIASSGMPVHRVETPVTAVETGGVTAVETDISSITCNIQLNKEKNFSLINNSDDRKEKTPSTPLGTFQQLLGRRLSPAEMIEFASLVRDVQPATLYTGIVKTAANKEIKHPVAYLRTCLNSGISVNPKTGQPQQFGKALYTRERLNDAFRELPENERVDYIEKMYEPVEVNGQSLFRPKRLSSASRR